MPRSTPRPASACLTVDASTQGGQFVASLIAADGYIYVINEAATFAVLRSGDTLELAALNKLGASVRCTPAIAGDTLYVRPLGLRYERRRSKVKNSWDREEKVQRKF
jgi:hypothetical protein